MTRVLIVTGGPIGDRMAGPSIRSWHQARVLAADGHEVRLVTTATLDPESSAANQEWASLAIAPGDVRAFAEHERWAEVVVVQGHGMEHFPVLASTDRALVADCYDPMHLEMLEQGREQPRGTWDLLVSSRTELLNQQLAIADLVLCASPRQRQFYLGQLAALGRITPEAYEDDPHLERLLAVAPYGLEATPPVRAAEPVLRGVVPGIGPDDRVLVWGGGLYSWFDPATLIRATAALAARRPETKLLFLGTRTPGIPPMGVVAESIQLARELGALDRSVHFGEDWVPYAERGAWLAEADAGVSTHHVHLETEFSFRTRILDYLWAGLPMVVTEGDFFAELVAREGLGLVVPAEDAAALEAALERILYDDALRTSAAAAIERVRGECTWEVTMRALREFVAAPRIASAFVGGRRPPRLAGAGARPATGFRRDVRLAWHYLRHGGVGEVLRRVRARRERG